MGNPRELLAARFVAAVHVHGDDASAVASAVSRFLGPPPRWTIAFALENGLVKLAWELAQELEQDTNVSDLEKIEQATHAVRVVAKLGDLELIEYLCAALGGTLDLSAMLNAAEAGQLKVLNWWRTRPEARPPWDCRGNPTFPESVVMRAAMFGRFEVAQWLIDQLESDEPFPIGIIIIAAEHGHVEMVQWLCSLIAMLLQRNNRYVRVIELGIVPLSQLAGDAFRLAAEGAVTNGHLDVLQQLQEARFAELTPTLTDMAAVNGHFDIVGWMNAPPSDTLVELAAAHGHLESVKDYVEVHRCSCSVDGMDKASKFGHFEVVQYLHDRGFSCSMNAMDWAAMNGHLKIVRWLNEHRSEGCTNAAVDYAVSGGHIEVVKYLITIPGVQCSIMGFWGAAQSPSADMMQLLLDTWGEKLASSKSNLTWVFESAAQSGSMEVVKLLARLDLNACARVQVLEIVKSAPLEMLTWLHESQLGVWDGDLANSAVLAGNSWDVVQWLDEHCSGSFTEGAAVAFLCKGSLNEIAWLHTRDPDLFTRSLGLTAVQSDRPEVIRWFVANVPGADLVELHDAAAGASSWPIVRWLDQLLGKSEGGALFHLVTGVAHALGRLAAAY